MALSITQPNFNVPFIDQKTGLISLPWRMYLLSIVQSLSNNNGSINLSLADLQNVTQTARMPPDLTSRMQAAEDLITELLVSRPPALSPGSINQAITEAEASILDQALLYALVLG